jgi:hypothetical protein
MKHVKSVFAVAALVAISSPTAALAAKGEDGLEACVSALVKDLSDAQDYPMQATISEDSFVAEERLGRRTRIHLDARDPVSREIVAKADCIVNRHAEVVRLERLPDEAPEAKVRSL